MTRCWRCPKQARRSRFQGTATADAEGAMIDLSQTVEHGMVTCQGLPAPLLYD